MSKPKRHIAPILSLENLVKYVKGNLLGDKRKEVEMELNNSPLLQDAADGLKEFKRPEKVQSTVDDLNKMIAMKVGSQVGQSSSTSSPGSGGKILALNTKALAAIGAAATVVIAIGVGLYLLVDSTQNIANQEAVVADTANESLVDERSSEVEKPLTFNELQALDSARLDSIGTDSIPNLALVEDDIVPGFSPNATYNVKLLDANATGMASEDKFEAPEISLSEEVEAEAEEAKEPEQLTFTWGNSNTNSNNELLEKEENGFYGSEPNLSQETTGFDKKDYETDSGVSKSSESSYKRKGNYSMNSQQRYEHAMTLLENGNDHGAIPYLEKVADDKNSDYRDDAIWQLANIYIKRDDKRKAKRLLKKIDSSPKYGEKAGELLDEL